LYKPLHSIVMSSEKPLEETSIESLDDKDARLEAVWSLLYKGDSNVKKMTRKLKRLGYNTHHVTMAGDIREIQRDLDAWVNHLASGGLLMRMKKFDEMLLQYVAYADKTMHDLQKEPAQKRAYTYANLLPQIRDTMRFIVELNEQYGILLDAKKAHETLDQRQKQELKQEDAAQEESQ